MNENQCFMESQMKKLLTVSLLAVCPVLMTPALAQFQGPGPSGGYTGPSSATQSSSVADILRNPIDHQQVVLRGNVIRHIRGDNYMFTDGTGEIRVDIDRRELPAQPFNDKTVVEITGRVDTEFMRPPEVDVKAMRIVQ
jgi:uncharacterized protein (TIGR00156 family)